MIDAFAKLDRQVQKWVYKQGWTNLREIQSKAIPPILACDRDLVISASTAEGKTEAFFLPGCSAVVGRKQAVSILYISPLKALINDQYRRLRELCDMLDMQVTPWHGDVSQSKKKHFKRNPQGILLITPESLESLLIREAGWIKPSFSQLKYVCVDEFHAFIGTERGQQLLSLLNRMEHLLNRLKDPIPRIALSATLGELDKVPLSLRPNGSLPCKTITSSKFRSPIKVQVKGFVEPAEVLEDESNNPAEHQICREIYQRCRGDSHLVFAVSRERTESIAVSLADFCEQNGVPNEFFPHHGSLAKNLREDLEARLQIETIPTTAVCTMTLELGIDIGKVNSVVQVTAPHSVSSLRQRMGRSGRRNSPAVLQMLIAEKQINKSSNINDHLRLELVQSLAIVRLMIVRKWFEPPDVRQLHLSTFVHQILAVIAQWGSIRTDQLYVLLCDQGPFKKISVGHYKQLLTHMGKEKLLQQFKSGELVLGIEGERVVNHYTFYSVFHTPIDYRVVTENKTLGSLPAQNVILKEQHIVFGGKRWKVTEIDDVRRVINVVSAKGGNPPKFNGSGISVHDAVRMEMYRIYSAGDYRIEVSSRKIDFADDQARHLFQEAAEFFHRADLKNQLIVQIGTNCHLFTWMGDKIINTLTVLLKQRGFVASSFGGVVEIQDAAKDEVKKCLTDLANGELPTETELARELKNKRVDKYDRFIPEILLNEGYGRKAFDSNAARDWIRARLCH